MGQQTIILMASHCHHILTKWTLSCLWTRSSYHPRLMSLLPAILYVNKLNFCWISYTQHFHASLHKFFISCFQRHEKEFLLHPSIIIWIWSPSRRNELFLRLVHFSRCHPDTHIVDMYEHVKWESFHLVKSIRDDWLMIILLNISTYVAEIVFSSSTHFAGNGSTYHRNVCRL